MGDLGPLASALAKAQGQFATVKRDKTVTVSTKTGGSYSFSYAPLESILGAVRKPLADNGLVLVQQLNDGALDTSLIHDSGAILSGSIDIPATGDIQAFGSAITYLRRYAIQAMLGIAAEDDDDGNHAAGNIASPTGRSSSPAVNRPAAAPPGGGWSGPVSKGHAPVDGQLRPTEDGQPAYGFVVEAGGKRVQILALGPLAEALAIACAVDFPATATVDGDIEMVPWEKKQPDGTMKQMPPFRRVIARRIETPEWTLPAAGVAPVPERRVVEDDLDGLDF